VTAPVATPDREHWTERIPHRDGVMLEDVDLFAGFFVACEREDGLPRLRLWRFQDDGPKPHRRARLLSPSRLTAPSRTSTASSRRPCSATPTSRW
jgi:protease II